ncbi:hypothetical protein [Escherichia coli]|uniref:hypothetical protein n=1 Tax=Escherichia coli TaxID=562 RepID=UPI001CA707AE|nr:hypothetical protein [Escherichia coli]QZY67692.1 hypothetical protein K7X33_16490 [Escherichia coli]
MKKLSLLALLILAGCSSQASRMYECESQGISRDACYVAEQNRQSSINSAAEKQAMENAQAQYPTEQAGHHHHHHASQYAQAAHKERVYKGFGQTFKMHGENFAYLNDVVCAVDENNADATTYSEGLYTVIHYKKTGKVILMKQGQLVGSLK